MNEFFGNLALEVGINAVRKCAEKYGFDAEEAIELCGLDSIDNHVVFNKTKKGAAKKESTTEVQLKLAKPKFPFPYCGEYKKECCQGLKYNRGLFTQCLFIKTAESDYCKRCSSQAEKNEHGKPDCGSIQDRLNISFMDFRDPKGRAPISFVKVMRKLKISQEALLEEAGKFNFEIHSIHFVDPPPPGKKGRKAAAAATDEDDETPLKKGRPSKNKEVVVSTFTEEADLFATLTKKAAATATATEPQQQTHVEPDFFFIDETKQDDNNKPHTLSSLNLNSLVCPESSQSSSEATESPHSSFVPSFLPFLQSTTPIMPPPPTPEPAPALKTAAKETADPAHEPKQPTTKPAKKMTKEEKEAEKEAKLAAKEAEKAAKIAAKEAEKAAAKLAAKLAAKKTKAQEEKAPKKTKAQVEEEEAKKKTQAEEEAKKKTQAEEEESDEEDEDDEDEDEEDEELAKQEEDEDKADELASVQLDRFKYAGKSYFKDQFDVIYDMGNGNQIDPYPIGKWNKKKRSIEFYEE